MLVFRVANQKYKDSTLSGIGAEKVGGRWNAKGTRAVYCSENIALALLEYYIHSKDIGILPKEILVAKIQIPKNFTIKEIDKLPNEWNAYPYTSSTTSIFSDFALSSEFFALKVPSAIVSIEYNYILNPLYKNFGRVKVVDFLCLAIDDRLF